MARQDRELYALAFKIFGDFGVSIAVPAVLTALLGKWLDVRYGTEPRWLIILLVFAFILTAFSIRRKARRYGDEYQRLIK
ncbi:MAG: AtpZ/AtpI family protein [Patescibacteria group bacterium]